VWLFIQGGGKLCKSFHTSLLGSDLEHPGYTLNANWNGAEVVQKSGNNIVMVNFNYRVGIWGFLASDRVRQNGNLNAGMLDQRFLMQWVKTHIAQVCCTRPCAVQ
jgi:acetylcholinesterase